MAFRIWNTQRSRKRRCLELGVCSIILFTVYYYLIHTRDLIPQSQNTKNSLERISLKGDPLGKVIQEIYGYTNSPEDSLWMTRLISYTRQIQMHRQVKLKIMSDDKAFYLKSNLTFVAPDLKNYFGGNQLYSQMKTLLFGIAHDLNYKVVPNFYNWTCDNHLYKDIRTNTPWKYPVWFPNGCDSDLSSLFRPKDKLDPNFARNFLVQDIQKDIMKSDIASFIPTYVTIIDNAHVTGVGYIYSGNIKYVDVQCNRDTSTNPPKTSTGKIYDEVFVISQFFGEAVFHSIVEDGTRLGPYIPFLKMNKNILIHTRNSKITGNFIEFLGLERRRLISGLIRARIVYSPQTSACGRARPLNAQLYARALRNQVKRKFPLTKPRSQIVMMKRSGHRQLVHHNKTAEALKSVLKTFGYELHILKDNPMPSFPEVARMMNHAAMIIAPHGAGLSNILFCEPGTVVVETLCPYMPNVCFMHLAVVLGHRYHGISPTNSCAAGIQIPPEDIAKPVQFLLPHIKALG